MIAGDADDFGDDGEWAEVGANVVEGEPNFRAACDACGFDAADMADDLGACGEVDAAAGFEWFERADFEAAVAARAFGVEFLFEPDEKFGAGTTA